MNVTPSVLNGIAVGRIAIRPDCTLDAEALLLLDTVSEADGCWAYPSDSTIPLRWESESLSAATVIAEVLPLAVAEQLSDGLTDYFTHLRFVRLTLDERGLASDVRVQHLAIDGPDGARALGALAADWPSGLLS